MASASVVAPGVSSHSDETVAFFSATSDARSVPTQSTFNARHITPRLAQGRTTLGLPMAVPEHVHGFWKALDDRVGRVEPTWWGAVVTHARFPAVWDINYARIDVADEDLGLKDVADVLLPRLEEIGTEVFHVVSFYPQATTGLLT